MKLILATILAGSFLICLPAHADQQAPAAPTAPAAKSKNKKAKKSEKGEKSEKADKKSDEKAATPPSGGGW